MWNQNGRDPHQRAVARKGLPTKLPWRPSFEGTQCLPNRSPDTDDIPVAETAQNPFGNEAAIRHQLFQSPERQLAVIGRIAPSHQIVSDFPVLFKSRAGKDGLGRIPESIANSQSEHHAFDSPKVEPSR